LNNRSGLGLILLRMGLAGKGIVESATMACQKASNTTTVVRKQLLTEFLEYFRLTDPKKKDLVSKTAN
ncbi:hypothetical protein ACFLV6_02220, partial [Chloroflexota bacterium]